MKRTIFGPEHEAFGEMVRSFVAREVVPEYPKWEEAGIIFERRILKPVTNQVTTTPGNRRRSATYSDTVILLTCGNPTQPDSIGRNRHAW